MKTYSKQIKILLNRSVRNTIAKIIWCNAAYHSNFLLNRCGTEPYIANYNVFEFKLISDIYNYCKRPGMLINSNCKYICFLEEAVEYFADNVLY